MLIHPAIHLELARLRQQDAIARAERYRLARDSRRIGAAQPGFVARGAALVRSVLSRRTSAPAHRPARPGQADA
jgi:hypothetical protein